MENAIKNICMSEQDTYLPEILTLSEQSSRFPAIYKKVKERLLSLKEFLECPSFYEGEITDTSGFETKILQINKINNK